MKEMKPLIYPFLKHSMHMKDSLSTGLHIICPSNWGIGDFVTPNNVSDVPSEMATSPEEKRKKEFITDTSSQ